MTLSVSTAERSLERSACAVFHRDHRLILWFQINEGTRVALLCAQFYLSTVTFGQEVHVIYVELCPKGSNVVCLLELICGEVNPPSAMSNSEGLP